MSIDRKTDILFIVNVMLAAILIALAADFLNTLSEHSSERQRLETIILDSKARTRAYEASTRAHVDDFLQTKSVAIDILELGGLASTEEVAKLHQLHDKATASRDRVDLDALRVATNKTIDAVSYETILLTPMVASTGGGFTRSISIDYTPR